MPSLSAYWGKTDRKDFVSWHPLPCHMLDAAAVATVYLDACPWIRFRIDAIALGLADWLPFLVGLHDLGKFADGFQRMAPALAARLWPERGAPKPCQRHHSATGFLLWTKAPDMWANLGIGFGSGPGWDDLLAAILGHHGVPPVNLACEATGGHVDEAYKPEDRAAAAEFLQQAAAILAPPGQLPSFKRAELKKVSWLVAGFTILCDWVASNTEWFALEPVADGQSLDLDAYWIGKALPRARTALAATGLMPPIQAGDLAFGDLFPHLANGTPTPLQQAACDLDLGDGPWLAIVEDSPGTGKTEAALKLVNRLMARGGANGVYAALPTMATANMMFDRMAETYGRLYANSTSPASSAPSIVLAHGRAAFDDRFRKIIAAHGTEAVSEDGTNGRAQCAAWLGDSRKKALLAAVGVGTIDQALLGVLPSAHQALRLFGLAGNVLMVDEVHACDSYMNGLLETLLRFHAMLGGSAILISATLPLNQRRRLVSAFVRGCTGLRNSSPDVQASAFPLLTGWSPMAGLVERPVETAGRKKFAIRRIGSQAEALRNIIETANAGQCVCWVRNTVGDAITAYHQLAGPLGTDRVRLFHARFAPLDRDRIETEVVSIYGHPRKASKMGLRPGTVLVATQVVEQSLDLDFDVMYSDLAPIDLLIQRAGRLQRHDHGPRLPPVLHIVGPAALDNVGGDWLTGNSDLRGTSYVYRHDGQMWLSLRLLCDAGHVILPDDARHLVDGVYGDTPPVPVPASLDERSIDHDGRENANAYLANRMALNADRGYEREAGWLDDQAAPTRLGEPTVTLRLLRDIGSHILPWGPGTGMQALADGDVVLRRSQVDAVTPHTQERLQGIQDRWPDQGQWCVPVILTEQSDGHWTGSALQSGKMVMVTVNPVTGVSVSREPLGQMV